MDEQRLRTAVVLYTNGDVTEAEAAEIAGTSRAQFRRYVRTSGVVASVPASEGKPESV